MINWRHKVAVATITSCLLPGLALADVKVSFRLHGGWATISGGDINHGTQALFDWAELYYAPPYSDQIEGGYTPLHRGYEVGGDLIFGLTRTLGIGIGAGYTKMSRALYDSWIEIHHSLEEIYYKIFEGAELEAMSIRLGLFLSLPIASKIDFTANAGLCGYLRARYHADWLIGRAGYVSNWRDPYNNISTRADQKKFPIGFQAGAGIEYRLLPKIGLFIEARGRYAKFRGLEGTSTSEPGEYGGISPTFSEQGKLFYESAPMLPGAPRVIMVQSAPPAGPDGKPRQAVVDVSGVSLQAGIRIFF